MMVNVRGIIPFYAWTIQVGDFLSFTQIGAAIWEALLDPVSGGDTTLMLEEIYVARPEMETDIAAAAGWFMTGWSRFYLL